jgi:D-lactate dehydrogenase
MVPEGRVDLFLKQLDTFSCLAPEALTDVQDKLEPLACEPGEVVCREGETGDAMYVLISGRLSVLKAVEGGEVEIARLEPGEVLGAMSLFDSAPRSATVRAVEPAKLYKLDAETFGELLERNPATGKAMLACLSRRLRSQTRAAADLRASDTDRRLAVAVFDSKPYTERSFTRKNDERYLLKFFRPRLDRDTVSLAAGFRVVCPFVNDVVDAEVAEGLAEAGVGLVALRCAGYNNVALDACARHGLSAVRVPAYSPYAVAEHAVALMLALNRHVHRASNRIREGNFSLTGLSGFDMHGKTAGVVGTGKIGTCLVNILLGFGCRVLAYDRFVREDLAARDGVEYTTLERLLAESDIVSLHAPLTDETHHMIDADAIAAMKPGVMLINTSRGGLVDTRALIDALKTEHVGSAGLDVYEEESEYFFEDLSDEPITDDVLARLTTFNNVIVTSHQAFLTEEALGNIAETTLASIAEFEAGKRGEQLTHGLCPVASAEAATH